MAWEELVGLDISFVGRENEIAKLQTVLNSPHPSIAVVLGRRRIGKSLLIENAIANKRAIVIEGVENRPKKEQIATVLFQLGIHFGKKIEIKNSSWLEVFQVLSIELEISPCPVILDEFQWMANYRSEIVSDLKLAWDKYLSKISGVSLILCGSIASFMIDKVIRSGALYGRIDQQINLKPFTLRETGLLLKGKGAIEVLEAHLFTGGVPKYLQLLADNPSVRLRLKDLAFSENGYFVYEYDRIFSSHFGRNPEFERIVNVLAQYPYGLCRSQIEINATIAKGGGLSQHLNDLEAAGFISSQTPFTSTSGSRQIKYFLHDAFMRFYFAFIKMNLKDIKAGINPARFGQIWSTPAFFVWQGRAFEHLCLQHADKIALILGFSGIVYTCGPYFKAGSREATGVQIDLVFDRSDHVLTLCEMKYSTAPAGLALIAETEKKANILRAAFPRRTVQPVLISNIKPSADLLSAGYFVRIVIAEELM